MNILRNYSTILIVIFSLILAGCTIESKAPICNKPYIVNGYSCCLDKDSNAICDSDEQKTTTKTETTSASKVNYEKSTSDVLTSSDSSAPKVTVTNKKVDISLQPVMSTEKGYSIKLKDYRYSLLSSEKARITEMELEITNQGPNDGYFDVRVYVYSDDDAPELRNFPEETINSINIPSGYKITKKFPVSINVWKPSKEKNIKLSLYSGFTYDADVLATYSIKKQLMTPNMAVKSSLNWTNENPYTKLIVDFVDLVQKGDKVFLKNINFTIENKKNEKIKPNFQVKVADKIGIILIKDFNNKNYKEIAAKGKQKLSLDFDDILIRKELEKQFYVKTYEAKHEKEALTVSEKYVDLDKLI